MLARTLYVIGNGFDLHHGLAIGFSDFKRFVGIWRPAIQTKVEQYLCDLSRDWANLEEALARLDVDQLIDDASNFLVPYGADDWSDSYHHDYEFEIEEVVRAISSGLKAEFYLWIQQIQISPSGESLTRLRLEHDAIFLNFNYTPAIQKLYSVDNAQILHIHGSAANEEGDIILGHGWKAPDRPKLNKNQDPEQVDIRVRQGNDHIEHYFAGTFKPTNALIEKNQSFFDSLSGVSNVYVWGHSLSTIDLPYFAEIAASIAVNNPTWHVSYYSDSCIRKNAAAISSIGVSSSSVHHHKLSDYVL